MAPDHAQNKQDASEQLKQKTDLEAEAKRVEEQAVEKEKLVNKKCKTIGNYVHESVPVNDNEVCVGGRSSMHVLTMGRTSTRLYKHGPQKVSRSKRGTASLTMRL